MLITTCDASDELLWKLVMCETLHLAFYYVTAYYTPTTKRDPASIRDQPYIIRGNMVYISPLLFIVEQSKSGAVKMKLNTVFTLYFINLVLCMLEHKRISIYGNRRLVYNFQSFIERFFWHRPAYSCHRHPLFSNNTWKFVYKYFPCKWKLEI